MRAFSACSLLCHGHGHGHGLFILALSESVVTVTVTVSQTVCSSPTVVLLKPRDGIGHTAQEGTVTVTVTVTGYLF